jgi:hypothetical protein
MAKRRAFSSVLRPIAVNALQRIIEDTRTLSKFKEGIVALLGAALLLLYRQYRLRQRSRVEWRRRIDLSVIQAVLMSTERLEELGRVEKRTLFVKSIADVFKNEYIRERIIEAAQMVSDSGEGFFMKLMDHEDKWHVLTECQNHLSSLFAPYHIFFNEANRTQSYYHSAWYCLTLTCHQSEGNGRFFITPLKPVSQKSDTGMMRIRIVLVSEKELRDIASGAIEPPAGAFFSSRHAGRWQLLAEFAELFARQLERRDDADAVCPGSPKLPSKLGVQKGMLRNASADTGFRIPPQDSIASVDAERYPVRPEDNQFLRIHIPFPSVKPLPDPQDARKRNQIGAQDVVLFE